MRHALARAVRARKSPPDLVPLARITPAVSSFEAGTVQKGPQFGDFPIIAAHLLNNDGDDERVFGTGTNGSVREPVDRMSRMMRMGSPVEPRP